MDPVLLLAIVLLFALLGVAVGLGTGLLPGLHVNNVALLVLAAGPAFVGALVAGLGAGDAVLPMAAFLAAASVAHPLAALLPSVFLGAPDPDTALSVLPGHRLLAQGRGYEAVLLGASGAFLAALLALPLVVPFRLFLGPPVDAYDRLRPLLPFLLLLLVALLLATEGRHLEDAARAWRRRAWAVVLTGVSGLLGWLVLRPGFLVGAPFAIRTDALVLFPLFTGLFGLPTLLLSVRTRGRLPPQILGASPPLAEWRGTRGVLAGTLAGAAVSWFPGLGGANATVVAQLLAGGEPREDDADADREFLLAAGAANTATTVFTFAALFVILRARSGVAAAVDDLAGGVSPWAPAPNVPLVFAAVLLALLVSAGVAYAGVVRLARPFAVWAGRVRYGRLAGATAAGLAIAVGLVAGPVGLLVLATATGLGLVPPLVGVRRVHLMGCLLVPILAAAF